MPIGTDIPRLDGLDKLAGRTRYVDDLALPDMLWAATVRSPAARGRIRRIVFDPAFDFSEFVIVDHRDIPGANAIKLIETDQPVLAGDQVHHKHEPILLLAHRDRRRLRQAVRAIRVEIDPLPAVLDPLTPLTPELVQYGDDNVFKRIDIVKGDVERALRHADHIIEAVYRTGPQEHVYIEPQGMLASLEDRRLVVRGSMQCPYYVLDALMHAFGRDADAFRVIQTPIGGGFGGKEDYPSIVAVHAALLCEKSGRPVKLVYDRHEDMLATTKRHPSVVRHRTGVDADGTLRAMQVEVILDGGAYVTLSPVVLSRGCIHAAGPYFCENIHIHGEARLTNAPPYGAFRGFGAPQTLFAVERHMDRIARQLGLDPIELRRRNLLREGQTMATGQVFREKVDLRRLLDETLEAAQYQQLRREHAGFNRTHPHARRGVGIACFYHGAGFTGSGEQYLASRVQVEGCADGSIEVLTSQTDMGQGTRTILAQIAADALDVPEQHVRIAEPDTSRVPNSGPTVASRTAMVVGRLVAEACRDLLGRLDEAGIDAGELPVRLRAWHAAHRGQRLVGQAQYRKPEHIHWDEEHYRGDAYACYSWACYVADVEVDLRTLAGRVRDFVAAQEVGRVVNPTLARGQIAGGVAQGIGWALLEDVVLEDGAMANAQLTNYIIPTAADLPQIRVIFHQAGGNCGPGGAKGIGELPMDGPAPAVVNALCDALGCEIDFVPATPEKLMALSDETAQRERAQG